jgi:hypothetical protein
MELMQLPRFAMRAAGALVPMAREVAETDYR